MFHRVVAVNSLSLLKGNWLKPSKEEVLGGLRTFQHIIEETNRRGIDLRSFERRFLSTEDKTLVYAGLPVELCKILDGNDPTNFGPQPDQARH